MNPGSPRCCVLQMASQEASAGHSFSRFWSRDKSSLPCGLCDTRYRTWLLLCLSGKTQFFLFTQLPVFITLLWTEVQICLNLETRFRVTGRGQTATPVLTVQTSFPREARLDVSPSPHAHPGLRMMHHPETETVQTAHTCTQQNPSRVSSRTALIVLETKKTLCFRSVFYARPICGPILWGEKRLLFSS